MAEITDVVEVNGVPINGVTISVYKRSRFGGVDPVQNSAPPAGGPDATGVSGGTGPGAWQVVVPDIEDYWASSTISGQTGWQLYPLGQNAGSGAGVPIDTTNADYKDVAAATAWGSISTKGAAPDHTHLGVRSLVAGTGISITGSLPNPTINATTSASLDGNAADLAPIAQSAVAGSIGLAPHADHVHPGLGLPLLLTGANQAARYLGATAGGSPASGTFQLGDVVIDQTGAIWICTVAGTVGSGAVFVGSSGGVQSITAGVNVTLGGTANNPIINAAQNDPTIPSGYYIQSLDRIYNLASISALVGGEMVAWAITLIAGQVISKIAFMSGSTAAVSPTHQWFGLYSSAGAALAATSDDTTTAWAANALKSLNIGFAYSGSWGAASSFTVASSGLYYVVAMVTAGTLPSLLGFAYGLPAYTNLAPIMSGLDSTHTGLTTPSTAPATATLVSGINDFSYFLIG